MTTNKTTKSKAGAKTAAKRTTRKSVKQENKHIGLVKNDSWLEPYEDAIRGRHEHALWKIAQLTRNGKKTLSDLKMGGICDMMKA